MGGGITKRRRRGGRATVQLFGESGKLKTLNKGRNVNPLFQ